MNPLLDQPPFAVCSHFAPFTDGLKWQRVPGGFSLAHVYRGDETSVPRVALKGWPANVPFQRVQQVHTWLARAHDLPFVPTVFPGFGGHTAFAEDGHVWDCCRWMPGTPRAALSTVEVATACEELARLHEVWSAETQRGPCPGVRNRLRAIVENEPLLLAGVETFPPVSLTLDPLLRRAVVVAARVAPLAIQALRPWESREFAIQPCVRDLRGEHVLFEDGRVGGIIDYGAMAVDHPAVDLARFLGDVARCDESLFTAGLNAYRSVRANFDAPNEFVSLLSRTGILCSILGWMNRLAVRRERPVDPLAVALRLDSLVARVEQFTSF